MYVATKTVPVKAGDKTDISDYPTGEFDWMLSGPPLDEDEPDWSFGDDPDALTILHTLPPVIATKRWTLGADGGWSKEGYGNAANFHVTEIAGLTGIDDLAAVIQKYAADPHAMIIRGALTDAGRAQIAAGQPVKRRKRNKDGIPAHFHEVERQWFMVDVDGFPMLPGESWAAAVQRYVAEMLPACFQDVRCFWQLSSSAGFESGILKSHLWFWLSEPLIDERLKATLAQHAPGITDLSVYQGVQPHYIAAPIVEGGPDPIADRFGRTHGWLDAVTLPEWVLGADPSPGAHGGNGSTPGAWLERLSPEPGHFHEPMRTAAWEYATLVQRGQRERDDDAEIERWIALCHDRRIVQQSDWPVRFQANIEGAFNADHIKTIEPIEPASGMLVPAKVERPSLDTLPIDTLLRQYPLKHGSGIVMAQNFCDTLRDAFNGDFGHAEGEFWAWQGTQWRAIRARN